MLIEGKNYIGKEYYDKDYFETPGYKSGYDTRNLRRDSYLNKAIAAWITQTLKLNGNERILEIGCAFGWVVEQMVKFYGFDCYGQDISAYSTANAPAEIKSRIRECKDVEIAFSGQFNLVYAIETFEHVPKPLVPMLFKNIFNCLKEEGLLFCTICLGHNDNRGADLDQSHQTLQPREWWNQKLEEAGFTIRKDLEAEAYELGLQTAEMSEGQWLPRKFNWHVFVAQKGQRKEEVSKIYDRHLMIKGKKPKLLVLGSRNAHFRYPANDFFQIDNWGNYLSYFFDAEFRTVAEEQWQNIPFQDYDLLVATLDHYVAKVLMQSNWLACKNRLCFMDGTHSMMVEEKEHRECLVDIFANTTVILAHQPQDKLLAEVLGFNAVECSHIFPFRYFDKHFQRHSSDGFTILCAGFYDSHAALSSFSALLASRKSDKVLIAFASQLVEESAKLADLRERSSGLPLNVEVFLTLDQSSFYGKILGQADLVLKMDNPAGVGRIIAEAAAGCIPAISSGDLFQIRCFPELMVRSFYALDEILFQIEKVRSDRDFAEMIGNLARERLLASNKVEFQTMIQLLKKVGFQIEEPHELYW